MRTAALTTVALSLALGSLLGCSAHNVVGELPDGGGGSTTSFAGSGGAAAAGGGSGGRLGVGGAAGGIVPGNVPGTSQIPRLTNAQYTRTVRDLVGVTALTAYPGMPLSAFLPPDDPGPLTDIGWNSYSFLAQAIAAQVMADPALRPRFLACTPTGDGTACLHDTIVSFGRRAFRRPLTSAEVARFDKIVAAGPRITPTGAPAEIAEVLLEALLSSPSFLQRSEIASTPDGQGRFVLSPYEVASRLSYLIWGSAPDDTLNQAADAGQLASKDQLRAQAQRMLGDARAREQVAAFHDYYLRSTSYWGEPAKDPARYPAYNQTFAADASQEIARFFDTIAFDQQGSFEDLLTSPLGFVTRNTASTYGLDPSRYGSGLTAVTLDAARRPGFLSRIAFLSATAPSSGALPIQRGTYVIEHLLEVDLPGPHPANLTFPVAPPGGFPTDRAYVEAYTTPSECAGCHASYLDPASFVLEAYDDIGGWRTMDPSSGAPIDTSVTMVIDGVRVALSGPADLMAHLASSTDAQHVYARRLVSYGYEREEDPLDAATVEALAARIAGQGYPLLNLFVDLTQPDAFTLRAKVTP
jgi:hypothetical protein